MEEPHKEHPLWKRLIQPALRAIITTNDSPRQIAAGAALGVFVALTPTLGIQMIIALFLATLLRVSRIPAMAMVYITNPVTALPIYGACYWFGVRLCRFFGLPAGGGEAFQRFREALSAGADMSMFEHFWQICRTFAAFGLKLAVPLWLGAVLIGLAAAALTYPIALRIVEGHRVLRAQRLARKLQRKVREEDGGGSDPDAVDPIGEAETKEAPHESEPAPERRAGTDRVDPSSQDHAR